MSEVSVTHILQRIKEGDSGSNDELWTIAYHELRKLAQSKMSREKTGHTLQATDLVNEVYIRVMKSQLVCDNTGHFFATCAMMMHRILIDRARRKRGQVPVTDVEIDIEKLDVADLNTPVEVLEAVNEALEMVEKKNAEGVNIARLRYYLGMTIPEVAEATDMPEITVKRKWDYVRSQLIRELKSKEFGQEKQSK